MNLSHALALAILGGSCSRLAAQIPYARIRHADREPGSWLTYSGDYAAHRFSPLTQVTPANVTRLRLVWAYQASGSTAMQATPLVSNGIMYLTEGPSTVTALDLRTGRPLWRWSRSMPRDVRHLGFGPTNRGVALLDSTVFIGTLDAHLVALDARNGAVRWDVVVGDNAAGYAITGAPLALDGLIVVGVSGGEAGIRGFLDAYDARTGVRRWRFWTVPAPGEAGSDTWTGDSWKTGGGATWVTGSYDPELDLLYWGVGNPGPDWNGDGRPGDNLYTCSLLAIEAATGRLRWHFQFTPHDTHDWDANEIPVLFEGVAGGRPRKLVAMANRNAFYYVLDRETGEFLVGVPYAKQTWAAGLDQRGRPMVVPGTEPTESGVLVYPSANGATVWFSPAYELRTRTLFVAVREKGSYYHKTESEYKPGALFMGGGERDVLSEESYGAVRALAAETGRQRWEFRLQSPPWGGLLATGGGLVFGGSNEGNFFALAAGTGTPVWQFQTGAAIESNPISFLLDARQHVAVAAGHAVFVFALP